MGIKLGRYFLLSFLCSLGVGVPPRAGERRPAADMHKELTEKLSRAKDDLQAAQAELDYWKDRGRTAFQRDVELKGGRKAEVLVLQSLSSEMPGFDLSLALLFVEGRIIDCKSVWTYNRFTSQDPRLEDVDRDGLLDLSFPVDREDPSEYRKHTKPGAQRAWLYAFSIGDKGFASIFPQTERGFRLKHEVRVENTHVTAEVKRLPERSHGLRLVACDLVITNTSTEIIRVTPGHWFVVSADDSAVAFVTYSVDKKKDFLRPGETLVQPFHMLFGNVARDEVVLHFSVRLPSRDPALAP